MTRDKLLLKRKRKTKKPLLAFIGLTIAFIYTSEAKGPTYPSEIEQSALLNNWFDIANELVPDAHNPGFDAYGLRDGITDSSKTYELCGFGHCNVPDKSVLLPQRQLDGTMKSFIDKHLLKETKTALASDMFFFTHAFPTAQKDPFFDAFKGVVESTGPHKPTICLVHECSLLQQSFDLTGPVMLKNMGNGKWALATPEMPKIVSAFKNSSRGGAAKEALLRSAIPDCPTVNLTTPLRRFPVTVGKPTVSAGALVGLSVAASIIEADTTRRAYEGRLIELQATIKHLNESGKLTKESQAEVMKSIKEIEDFNGNAMTTTQSVLGYVGFAVGDPVQTVKSIMIQAVNDDIVDKFGLPEELRSDLYPPGYW